MSADDRVDFSVAPTKAGFYGILSSNGEGEVWVGVDYWDGASWRWRWGCAYARSRKAFDSRSAAEEWVHRQPD